MSTAGYTQVAAHHPVSVSALYPKEKNTNQYKFALMLPENINNQQAETPGPGDKNRIFVGVHESSRGVLP